MGNQFVAEGPCFRSSIKAAACGWGRFELPIRSTELPTLISIPSKPTTVGDILRTINNSSIGVEAKLNETGDGIVIIDTAGGAADMKIEDSNGGNAALDLGIRGTSKNVTVESVSRKQVEGSQTFRLELAATDKLSDVVKKINDASGPLTASLLTSGLPMFD